MSSTYKIQKKDKLRVCERGRERVGGETEQTWQTVSEMLKTRESGEEGTGVLLQFLQLSLKFEIILKIKS